MSDAYDLVLAAYPAAEQAQKDFDELVKLVKAKKVKTEGVILVTKDEAGEVHVTDTGDHLGRKGMGWGGGVGVLVGLAAPPLLGAVAVGAAAGGIMGKFAKKKVDSGLESGMGEKLKPGMAAIVAMVDADDRLAAEQAMAGAPAKSVAPMEKSGVQGPQGRPRRGGRQVQPRPHRAADPGPQVRRHGRAHARRIGRPTGRSSPGPSAPEGAPNVLIVLIDDAGFGGPDTFGGGIRTPTLTRVREMGLTYNRFHVTAVCSPTRAAMLTGRNHHRVGMGGIAELPGPFPGYTGTRPRSCTALPRILRENGYITAGFGKWHMTPGREMGAAGPFDHWPTGWGFDHWWGFLTGAAGQYDPIITQDNSTLGVPPERDDDGKLYYFPDDITDKSIEWLHHVRAQDANKPWFVYYSTGATHAPHHVAKEWADKYKGQFDDGWDAYRLKTFERQKQLGIIPQGRQADRAPRPLPGVGLPHRRAEEALRPSDGGLRGLLREHRLERRAAPRRDRADGRARQHAHPLHLGRQRRQHGGHDHRLVQRDDLLQRRRPRGRRADGDHREVRRHRGAGRLPHRAALRRGLGARQQHAVPVGQADGEPPGRRPRPDGRGVAKPHQARHGAPGPVHPLHRRRADGARARRHPRAHGGRRHRPGADGRDQLRLHARRPVGRRAAHGPVLRDVRQPRHLQGRLVGLRQARQAPLGLQSRDAQAASAREGPGTPRQDRVGAVLPARRLQPGNRPRGRRSPRSWRS